MGCEHLCFLTASRSLLSLKSRWGEEDGGWGLVRMHPWEAWWKLWHLGEEGLGSWTSEYSKDAPETVGYVDVLGRQNQRQCPAVNGSDSSWSIGHLTVWSQDAESSLLVFKFERLWNAAVVVSKRRLKYKVWRRGGEFGAWSYLYTDGHWVLVVDRYLCSGKSLGVDPKLDCLNYRRDALSWIICALANSRLRVCYL